MFRGATVRIAIIALATIVSALVIVPSVLPKPPAWLAAMTPERGAKLGLDLQGGMYLVLSVGSEEAVRNRARSIRDEVQHWLQKQNVDGSAAVTGETAVQVNLPEEATDGFRDLSDNWGDSVDVGDVVSSGGRATFTLSIPLAEATRIRDWAVLQSLETIRNRIDQYGIAEPSIQRQGDNKIVIQLPGVTEPERAKQLIGKTAQLAFHLLRDDVNVDDLEAKVDALVAAQPQLKSDIGALNAAMAATLPAGVAIRFQRVADEFGSFTAPVLVDIEPLMTGDTIVDARVRVDSQFNEPYVALEFSQQGGKRFEEVTAEHTRRRMAIVLDEVVYSAPVIRERIAGGRASIEGGFTVDEARDLAIVLRAGALPAPVQIEEERTVGPSLGEDSIRTGVNAILFGSALVFVFMLVYYKFAGLVANVTLVANLLLLIAIMSVVNATFTLPGLAGMGLTIGMAVDGNIIIYERIREELRHGRSVRAAVESGFGLARWTILDANITMLIASLILFQFGTGPIRGFAVTLSLGILTTVVTNLYLTRWLMDFYVGRRNVRHLPI